MALNFNLQQKKKLDEQLEAEILAVQLKYDKLSHPIYLATNDIVNGKPPSQEETQDLDSFLNDKEKE